jgi:hypothetical protein
MTDRELLESAAKAAGLAIHRWLPDGTPQLVSTTHVLGAVWNPLTDDGDALRLAVKLGIHVSQQLSYCATFCPHGDNSTRGTTWTEQYNADPAAATRRAIVRAAAAIGGRHD